MTPDADTPHSVRNAPEHMVDWLIVLSWCAVLLVAAYVLRPASVHVEQPRIETAAPSRAARLDRGPDFYPWIRPGSRSEIPEGMTPWAPQVKPRNGGFLTRLHAPLSDTVFSASDHGNAQSFYGGDWLPENISPRNGGAFLEVRRQERNGMPYTAAEMQTEQKFLYGRYETIMQPARGSGLVTAFFTYTGPWFGDPHDEIDIEFLGSDTTKIHFNYFRNGKSIKPATFDLPFDAAARPHVYAFEWRPDGVTWFVDGEPYYATEPGDPGVPVSAGKVMFSAWTGKPMMEGWHGPPSFRNGSGAQFNCVSFTPLGHDTPKCSDFYNHTFGAKLSRRP